MVEAQASLVSFFHNNEQKHVSDPIEHHIENTKHNEDRLFSICQHYRNMHIVPALTGRQEGCSSSSKVISAVLAAMPKQQQQPHALLAMLSPENRVSATSI